MRGYYIHNQKKDNSGVSKKIDAQMKVFKEHFEMYEIILEKKKENKIQRKVRQKMLKRKPLMLYDKALSKVSSADFVYIRKQILDQDFLFFLQALKEKNPACRILMEVPTYPYWNEYPKNKLGERIIEEEKKIIPQLKGVIDLIVDVGNEKNIFDIPTVNIQNGLDPELVHISSKKERTESINLIAVAKWRDVHGYERIINGMIKYYQSGGTRNVILHMVGSGPETEFYKSLADNKFVKNRIKFYGYKTGTELEKIYNEADIGLGVFGFYKTGGTYVSAIKCAEYLMRGLPVVSAVDESYLENLRGKYYLGFSDDESDIDLRDIIDFFDDVYPMTNVESEHLKIRNVALELVAVSKVMTPVIEWLEE